MGNGTKDAYEQWLLLQIENGDRAMKGELKNRVAEMIETERDANVRALAEYRKCKAQDVQRKVQQMLLKHLGDYYFDMHLLDIDQINIEHWLERAADELTQQSYTLTRIRDFVSPPPYTEGELYEVTQVEDESEADNG